ncbi:MAG: hypothetical protein FVQ79_04160 [Planctomycetes bacterium]|nr:hypothetical protein [Planctomycetota bacterium]
MRNIPGKEQRALKWFVHLATEGDWVARERALALGAAPLLPAETGNGEGAQHATPVLKADDLDEGPPDVDIIDAELEELPEKEAAAPPQGRSPAVDEKDPVIRWSSKHLAAVAKAGHAKDLKHAQEVLNRSVLPISADPEVAVRWASVYRGLRDQEKTAAQAARVANATYEKWVREQAKEVGA